MLETLANFADIIAGIAVIASLLYVAFQVNATRKQIQANALQQRMALRIETWSDQMSKEALLTAREKIFEHEIYRRDALMEEIEELTFQERRALTNSLAIEVVYFHMLFYLRQLNLVSLENSKPLDTMVIFRDAPFRREWKDRLRLSDNFPDDYIRHVDRVVKKYDEVERRMSEDQDADIQYVTAEVFNRPPPPRWID